MAHAHQVVAPVVDMAFSFKEMFLHFLAPAFIAGITGFVSVKVALVQFSGDIKLVDQKTDQNAYNIAELHKRHDMLEREFHRLKGAHEREINSRRGGYDSRFEKGGD